MLVRCLSVHMPSQPHQAALPMIYAEYCSRGCPLSPSPSPPVRTDIPNDGSLISPSCHMHINHNSGGRRTPVPMRFSAQGLPLLTVRCTLEYIVQCMSSPMFSCYNRGGTPPRGSTVLQVTTSTRIFYRYTVISRNQRQNAYSCTGPLFPHQRCSCTVLQVGTHEGRLVKILSFAH